jgi:hypothetical protein
MAPNRRATLIVVALLLSFAVLFRLVTAQSLGSAITNLPLVVSPMPTALPTAQPTTVPDGSDTEVSVGAGYTDVSSKQLVRTSENRLYVAASNCEAYPCTAVSQTIRMYRANASGVPSGFTRVDLAREPGGVAGWAIAIDGDNLIHVAWTDRSSDGNQINRVRYTTFNTANDTWGTAETVDSFTFELGGQGVQSVALVLDATGNPHLVYLKGTGNNPDRRIYYRNRIGGSWSNAQQIDDTISYTNNQRAWHPNLAFDPDGRLLVLWERGTFNDTADGTIYSRVRATNSSWGSAVAVSSQEGALTSIDQSTSIVITPDGTYHTAYVNASTTHSQKYIRYRYSTDQGATWKSNDPGGGTQATHNPSLGLSNGKVRIYGHGTPDSANHGENLYYFESNGASATWGSWTKIITGTNYDSSVNVRWSQYFYNFPTTTDFAYWDDKYPNQLFVCIK